MFRRHSFEKRFHIRVAIMRILNIGAFSEELVGFIEEQYPSASFGKVEKRAQILFGFADVLAYDRTQIHAK